MNQQAESKSDITDHKMWLIQSTLNDKRTGNRLYTVRHDYWTDRHEHKNLGDCIVELFKPQEDFNKQQIENPEPIDMHGVTVANVI